MKQNLKIMVAPRMDYKELLDTMQQVVNVVENNRGEVNFITFANLKNCLSQFEQVCSVDKSTQSYTMQIAQCKQVLNDSWLAIIKCLDFLKDGLASQDVKDDAQMVESLIVQFGNPLYCSYERKCSIVYSVLELVKQIDCQIVEKLNLSPYFDAISKARQDLKNAIDQRQNFKKNLPIYQKKSLARQLCRAYTNICREITFIQEVASNDTIDNLISILNVVATDINAKVQARKTLKQTKSANDEVEL